MSDIALPAIASPRIRWLRRYGLAVLGAAIILAWIIVAIFAPWLTPYDPNFVDVAQRLLPPSAGHWLGTDALPGGTGYAIAYQDTNNANAGAADNIRAKPIAAAVLR